jgi:3-dehydroquinate synthase
MIAGEQRVRVELGDARSYDVVIGGDAVAAVQGLGARTYAVVFDYAVAELAERIITALGDRCVMTYGVESGEDIKSVAIAQELWDLMAEARVDRDAVLVAIGGGTVTDLGGFAAATYARGIKWCAIPTTLLAAVDAAVGGKTAINLYAGKNLVGVIHHPAFVAIDPAVFATLDERDLAAGLAEAVKTACVADPELFDELERELPRALACDPDVLATIVARCVAAKARIVGLDEHDRTDVRAVLNFGHTVGHALENTCGYGELRHGEAVALGMRVALALSRTRGLAAGDAARIDALIRSVPVPDLGDVDVDAVIAATASDKKRKEGRVRFILLRGIGVTSIVDDVDEAELREAMRALT